MKNSTSTRRYVHLAPWKTMLPDGDRNDLEVVVDRTTGLIAHVSDPDDTSAWLAAEKQLGRDADQVKCDLLMPGITDSHMHPLLFPMLEAMNATTCQGMSEQQVFATIEAAHKAQADNTLPLVFTDLDTSKVNNLTASDLDRLTNNRDAIVVDASLHGGVVSSSLGTKLSQELGSKTMSAGCLSKDGTLTESYVLEALTLIQSFHPAGIFERKMEQDLHHNFSIGVTSIHDLIPLNLNSFLTALKVRRRWREQNQGDFPITRFYMRPEQVIAIGNQLADLESEGLFSEAEFREHVGIKLFADGSFGTRTALLSDEYIDHGGHGIIYDTDDQMNHALSVAGQYGLKTIAVHAIGDAGIRRALDLAKLWMAERGESANDCRFRIEHFELATQTIIDETKEIGCWVVCQPNFLLDVRYADRLGSRVEMICPHKEIVSRGIKTMFGTDGMPNSMLYAIYLATHAKHESQRITFAQALAASTRTAAIFEGDIRGEIAAGKKADLLLADRQLFTMMSAGNPDIAETAEEVGRKVSELEGMVQSVYKNGRQVYIRDDVTI